LAEARRHVARKLFLGEAAGLPQDALPLAMLAMDRGSVRWVDVAMVRRETGADTPLAVSMGGRPRALAEAFVLQYRRHLADVLADRARSGQPSAFAAAQYFAALPAAGQMPAAAILPDALGFRQLWFPPALDVTLSFVPADEIAVIVEESLAMPPIDFSADPAELDATAVVVLAPVSRQRLQKFLAALQSPTIAARPDPSQGLRQSLLTLQALAVRRTRGAETAARDAEAAAQAALAEATIKAWQAAWGEAVAAIPPAGGQPPLVWYIRRRAVPSEARISGIAVAVGTDDVGVKTRVDVRLTELGLTARVNAITAEATPFANARIAAFLGAPRISASDVLMASTVRDLEAALPTPAPTPTPGPVGPPILVRPGVTPIARPTASVGLTRLISARTALSAAILARRPAGQKPLLTEADVVDVASDYGDPRLGDGLDRLAVVMAQDPLARDSLLWLGDSGQALALDRIAQALPTAGLTAFADQLRPIARGKQTAALVRLLATTG
jgi:hypothetical protein